ncbi:hypothetical protein MWU78_01495 [Arenibacter sp. F26102]|uniref:hypothetical protein n=1 Tax=Arenibacter sp. F26102 TaxID=2926416 RepID=UPI001FF60E70|nr:hypothetical protein [Arenibacter sp. F26102]MCK0144319.1 hypothetical protein [Arenibacter sp. F26102]
MTQLNKDINEILEYIDKNRWIAFSKNDSPRRFKAKDKLRAFSLIERHGSKSWQLTKEGYNAVELGGFEKWLKKQNKGSNWQSQIKYFFVSSWNLVIIPIFVGIIVWFITENTNPNDGLKESKKNTEELIKEKASNEKKPASSEDLNNNKIYLQSFRPVEVFNGNLIVTLNNSIEAINGEIELKLVSKIDAHTEVLNGKKVGDLVKFKNYSIVLSSLKRNITTYDLIVKIEVVE